MLLKKVLVCALAVAATSVLLFTNQVGSTAAEGQASVLSQPSPAALAKQAVFIVMPKTPERIRAGGTGFLLRTPELGVIILTNKHVCDTIPDTEFFTLEQGERTYTAHLRKKSEVTDLCIIDPPQELLRTRTPLELAHSDAREGQALHVFGHPYLRPLTHAFGHFVNITREPIRMPKVFTPNHVMLMGRVDFMVHPGNSGSPVMTEAGKVVGIIFAMEGSNHAGLFVPLEAIRNFFTTGE